MKIKAFLNFAATTLVVLIFSIGPIYGQEKQPVQPGPEKKAVAKKVVKKRPQPVDKVTSPPTLEERLEDQRLAIRKGEQREQSSPYLIEEITVNGIYKSVEGYGAFLKAINGRTFFAYQGMPFFDGTVFQIDADQVIFEQSLPGGKKRQLVKAYDPSAIRNAAAERAEKQKKDREEEAKKKKKTKKDDDDDSEDAGTKDE